MGDGRKGQFEKRCGKTFEGKREGPNLYRVGSKQGVGRGG